MRTDHNKPTPINNTDIGVCNTGEIFNLCISQLRLNINEITHFLALSNVVSSKNLNSKTYYIEKKWRISVFSRIWNPQSVPNKLELRIIIEVDVYYRSFQYRRLNNTKQINIKHFGECANFYIVTFYVYFRKCCNCNEQKNTLCACIIVTKIFSMFICLSTIFNFASPSNSRHFNEYNDHW